jgi:cAMP-dependent protein kinase regulator
MTDAATWHVTTGDQAYEAGQWEKALSHYSQALKLNPEMLPVRQRVADLLVKLNRTDGAIKEYQRVAGAFAMGGHLFKSVAISNVISQLDPQHTETTQALAQVFARHPTPQPRVASLPSRMTVHAAPGTPKVTPTGQPAAPLMMASMTPARGLHSRRTQTPDALEVDTTDVLEERLQGMSTILVNPAELPNVPLFSDLAPEEFVAVLQASKFSTHVAGTVVVREGDPGESMFVLVQGNVAVRRQRADGVNHALAELSEGSFFGEMALLTGAPRLASVVALTDVMLLELTRADVDRIIGAHPSVLEVLDRFFRERLLDNLVRTSKVFRPLTQAQREAVVARFETVTRAPGELFLHQGQQGDGFYVLLRGKAVAFHTSDNGQQRSYPELNEGDVFGEISLLQNKPCSASVKAGSMRTTALRMGREDFEELVLSNAEVKAMLVDLSASRRKRTADVMTSILLGLENFRV